MDHETAMSKLADANTRVAELEAALRFYAHGASYCKVFGHAADDPEGYAPVLTDGGQVARTALGWSSPYPENM